MRISRLNVGTRPLSLAIVVVTLAVALACNGGDEAASTSPSDEIVYGGVLVRAHATDPGGLRPGAGHVHCRAGPYRAHLLAAGARGHGARRGRVAAAGARGAVGGRRGRQDGHVPPSAGGPVARRPALHRGRCGLPLQSRHLSAKAGLFSSQRAPFLDVVDIQAPDAVDGGLPHGKPKRGTCCAASRAGTTWWCRST